MVDTRFYEQRGPLSLGDLLQGLDVEISDPKFRDETIRGVKPLDVSQPGDLSFLSSRKFKSSADTAKATACFVGENLADFIGDKHIIPIVSKSPRAHFARAVDRMFKVRNLANTAGDARIAKTAHVHASVVIGAGAIIEDDVTIAPYAVIGPGVHIGLGSRIGGHSVIDCAVIGQNCQIKAHATIGGQGFGIASDEIGMVNIPHIGRVMLGDRVLVGSHSCIDRGQMVDTEIADDVKIDNLVQIAHNVKIGEGTVIASQTGIPGSVTLGRGVMLGGQVGIADHLTVGDGAVLTAQSGVMHNVPAGETWSGSPAMPGRNFMRMTSALRKMGERRKRDGTKHEN